MTDVRVAFDAGNYLGETPIWSAAEQALWWVNCENHPSCSAGIRKVVNTANGRCRSASAASYRRQAVVCSLLSQMVSTIFRRILEYLASVCPRPSKGAIGYPMSQPERYGGIVPTDRSTGSDSRERPGLCAPTRGSRRRRTAFSGVKRDVWFSLKKHRSYEIDVACCNYSPVA
jgi:hypothetical protein